MSVHRATRLRTAPAPQTSGRSSLSDILALHLGECGVEAAFGVSGGGIAPFLSALPRVGMKTYHFRHEGGAGFAAVESHFATGRPTLIFATTGPGLTNVLTGMLVARWEGAKVVLVSGGTPPGQRGRWPAQDTSEFTLPTEGLFSAGPLFHYGVRLDHLAQLPQVAWRLAAGLRRPGSFVAHVNLPVSLQAGPAEPLQAPVLDSLAPSISLAEANKLAELFEREPFVIWAGFGARAAAPLIRELAEKTGAAVMTTPRAKGVFPEGHPLFLGVTGLGGDDGVEERLRAIDPAHILVLGTRLSEASSYWQESLLPRTALVQVDLDPTVPGTAYQTAPTICVQAEVREFLQTLLPLMAARGERRLFTSSPAPAALTPRQELRVRPQFLLEAVQRQVVEGTEALLMAESGNSFAWAIHALRFNSPDRFRVSATMGSMGHFAAGAVGAAVSRPGKVVALVGDGSMLMNNELSTAVAYKAPAVWIVLNDARYGMVAQGMAAQGFEPAETEIPEVDFCALARSLGAQGVRVEREQDLEQALQQALRAEGPFVVDVLVDKTIPGPWMKRIQNLITQGAKGALRPKPA